QKATAPTNPTRTGHTFGGWYKESGLTTAWTFTTDTVTAATTIYAKWTANTYTITFDKQGGTGGSDSVIATYGSKVPLASMPTRVDGYRFDGYYSGTNGSGARYYTNTGSRALNWDIASNATLYANWKINDLKDVDYCTATMVRFGTEGSKFTDGETFYVSNIDGLYTLAGIVNGATNSTYGLNTVSAANGMSGATIIMLNIIGLNPSFSFEMDTNGNLVGSYTGALTWVPIGNNTNTFKGTFDGNGYYITGIFINGTNDYQGLFGYIDTGSMIKNLEVNNSFIKGNSNVGGIAGYTKGTIYSCANTAYISGVKYVGGIAGYCNGASGGWIRDCFNFKMIYGSNSEIGGIVGYVSSTSYSHIKIVNCHNGGEIRAPNAADVGGIAGVNSENGIENCYNTGNIYGGSDCGGIVGWNDGRIEYCYNRGAVSGSEEVGGVSGGNYYADVISCYNGGAITGSSLVGGITGWHGGTTITYCKHSGTVNGAPAALGNINGNGSYDATCTITSKTHTQIIAELNNWLNTHSSEPPYRRWQTSPYYLIL
ncbi:MAG: InlB B-repeat-containing protein, partial [Clostridia bacterium]|nr:InlB B-repeat-containing protein [Clostridia bacterium]